jgi:type II secretory pathway component PulM
MNDKGFRSEREVTELSRLLPMPGERDLPADRQHVLKEHLMTELRRIDRPTDANYRRKRPRRLVAVAGACVAMAVAVFVAWRPLAHTHQPAPATSPAAAELLAKIADAAASQPSPTVRNSEFMYIRASPL